MTLAKVAIGLSDKRPQDVAASLPRRWIDAKGEIGGSVPSGFHS